MKVKETVLEYFRNLEKEPFANSQESEILSCSYLDEGIIDSMGIVRMITEFENEFDIQFEADHLQSFEFQTIGGLIQIIEGLIKEKK